MDTQVVAGVVGEKVGSAFKENKTFTMNCQDCEMKSAI